MTPQWACNIKGGQLSFYLHRCCSGSVRVKVRSWGLTNTYCTPAAGIGALTTQLRLTPINYASHRSNASLHKGPYVRQVQKLECSSNECVGNYKLLIWNTRSGKGSTWEHMFQIHTRSICQKLRSNSWWSSSPDFTCQRYNKLCTDICRAYIFKSYTL